MPLYYNTLTNALPLRSNDLIDRVLGQIISATMFLHHSRILHRDIKPDNILVKGHQPFEVALCDFGVAAQMDNEIILNKACGTRGYCAPEIEEGRALSSPQADVYSLSATIFVIIEARLYLTTSKREKSAGLTRLLRSKSISFPKRYGALVQSMVALNPASRPSLGFCLDVVR